LRQQKTKGMWWGRKGEGKERDEEQYKDERQTGRGQGVTKKAGAPEKKARMPAVSLTRTARKERELRSAGGVVGAERAFMRGERERKGFAGSRLKTRRQRGMKRNARNKKKRIHMGKKGGG